MGHIGEIDPFDSPYDGDDTIGSDVALGFAVSTGDVQAAGRVAQQAGEQGDRVAKRNRGHRKGAKVASDIRKVTRSPYTAAAIAATAAVAPPVGTAVAGVASAGLAVAEGVAALAAPVGSLFSNGPRLFRKKKKRKPPVDPRTLSESELIKKVATARKMMEQPMPFMRMMGEAMLKKYGDELKRRQASASTKSGPALRTAILAATRKVKISAKQKAEAEEVGKQRFRTAERHKKAIKMLAAIMNRAKAGDEQAQDELIALKTLQDPNMVKAKNYAQARMEGFDSKEAKQLAARESELTTKQWNVIVRRARKLAESRPLPKVRRKSKRNPPNKEKLNGVIRAASKKLVQEADRASEVRGPIQGLLVETKRGKIRSGRFKNQVKAGIDGAVVLKNGRVILGDWKGV